MNFLFFELNSFRRFILAWVSGLIWSEVKQLWDVGLEEYVNDMWNVIDFVTNSLYVATAALRVVAYYRVKWEIERSGSEIELQREQWDTWDPMLISEGLFSAANIFRSFSPLASKSLFSPLILQKGVKKKKGTRSAFRDVSLPGEKSARCDYGIALST